MQVNCLQNPRSKPTIGITCGHPFGIGAEVFLKSLRELDPKLASYVYIGPCELLEKSALSLDLPFKARCKKGLLSGRLGMHQITLSSPIRKQGNTSKLQKWSLLKSVKLAEEGHIDAICTLPITKDALKTVDGRKFPGHTEFYEHYLGAGQQSLMCFGGAGFLLNLMTTHIPLSQIPKSFTKTAIHNRIERMIAETQRYWGKSDIQLTILGLNPHAGEGGLLGSEEKELIIPAIKKIQKDTKHKKIRLYGPLAADGFFGRLPMVDRTEWPHGVLAMYHDQGLAPYKLLGRGKIANITLGLSIPRTSPAHGTAFDIAQKKIADPTSMIEALETAIRLVSVSDGSPHARG